MAYDGHMRNALLIIYIIELYMLLLTLRALSIIVVITRSLTTTFSVNIHEENNIFLTAHIS